MNPTLRKANLTAHVLSSVGWLGAVVAFLALSIVGFRSNAPATVRACYVAMNLIGLLVIVPSSALALLTGIIQGLGTSWGLFRYYWVLIKFALTFAATALLLLHQFTAVAGAAQRVAASQAGTLPEVGRLATQLVLDSGLATVVLLVTTILSVFKPWGRIRSVEPESGATFARGTPVPVSNSPLGVRIFMVVVGLLLATVVALHVMGKGMGGHGM
jgi:hypothetical protein